MSRVRNATRPCPERTCEDTFRVPTVAHVHAGPYANHSRRMAWNLGVSTNRNPVLQRLDQFLDEPWRGPRCGGGARGGRAARATEVAREPVEIGEVDRKSAG